MNDQNYRTMFQMRRLAVAYDAAKARKENKMNADQQRVILQLVKDGIL